MKENYPARSQPAYYQNTHCVKLHRLQVCCTTPLFTKTQKEYRESNQHNHLQDRYCFKTFRYILRYFSLFTLCPSCHYKESKTRGPRTLPVLWFSCNLGHPELSLLRLPGVLNLYLSSCKRNSNKTTKAAKEQQNRKELVRSSFLTSASS